MKKGIKALIILAAITILIPGIFYLWFGIAMESSSKPKPINTASARTYKLDIQKDFTDISNVNIYYRFGKINFDFTANSSISLDQCKKIVVKTKEFIEKEGVVSLLPEGYGEQQAIMATFNINKDNYTFRSPYWVPTEDTTDNPNYTIKNNYKVWYMRVNDEAEKAITLEE